MVFPNPTEPDYPSFEIYPPEAARGHRDNPLPIHELRTGGGIVEIIQRGTLTAPEIRSVALLSAGLTDPQISSVMQYDQRTMVRKILTPATQKLGSLSRPHTVTRLFETRTARVIKSITPPDLTDMEILTLEQFSDGKSQTEVAANLAISLEGARHYMRRVRGKFDTANIYRAVLLARLCHVLPVHQSTAPIAATPAAIVWPKTTLDKTQLDQIDYIRWGRGSFTMSPKSNLGPREQRAVAFAAIGMSHGQMASYTGQTEMNVKADIRRAYLKLGALNRAHAVTQALATYSMRIVDYIRPEALSGSEKLSLFMAAQGWTSEQIAPVLSASESYVRELQSDAGHKMGVHNVTAAVMRAYMSRIFEVDDVIGTS